MDDSILNSTKKILGLEADYTPFDLDIITFINSAFSTMAQLGVGPADGFMIQDATANWADITYVNPVTLASAPLPQKQLNMVKTYVYLRARRFFDPASTRFVISAMNDQIQEHEWRLMEFMQELTPLTKPKPQVVLVEYVDVFTGSEVTIE